MRTIIYYNIISSMQDNELNKAMQFYRAVTLSEFKTWLQLYAKIKSYIKSNC